MVNTKSPNFSLTLVHIQENWTPTPAREKRPSFGDHPDENRSNLWTDPHDWVHKFDYSQDLWATSKGDTHVYQSGVKAQRRHRLFKDIRRHRLFLSKNKRSWVQTQPAIKEYTTDGGIKNLIIYENIKRYQRRQRLVYKCNADSGFYNKTSRIKSIVSTDGGKIIKIDKA